MLIVSMIYWKTTDMAEEGITIENGYSELGTMACVYPKDNDADKLSPSSIITFYYVGKSWSREINRKRRVPKFSPIILLNYE